MDETTNSMSPQTPPPEANGTPPEPTPLKGMEIRPLPPDPVTGEIRLESGPDAAAWFEDMGWFEDESWNGRWFPFQGKYVAILNKTHVGTDDAPRPLRERVAREHSVEPERVLIEYIPTDIFTEG